MKRYVMEYASDKIKGIRENDLMKSECKTNMIERIEKVIKLYEKSFITSEEAIKGILDI